MNPDRTIKGSIFAILIPAAVLIGASAHAQTTYVARQFAQPYSTLSGATTIFNFAAFDSTALIPIGFTFQYYGQTYDYVEVGENGALMFKQSCNVGCDIFDFCDFVTNVCRRGYLSQSFDPFPSANSPNNIAAAWWDDLTLDTSAVNTSIIQYKVNGIAPNRTFIVEWRNIRHYNQFTGAPSASRSSFQIQLTETTNNVRLAYGPFSQNAADNTQWQGKVGVEDMTAINSVVPLTCNQTGGNCDYLSLSQLNNQVIEIGIPNIPELTGVVVPTLGGTPGDTVTVHVEVQNVGRQPANAAFDTAVYLSTDNIISPTSDFLLGSGTLTFVPENGGTRTATITGTLPANFPPGYYTLGAIIDTANTITEATEANNTVLSEQLFLAGADLEVSFLMDPLPLPAPGSDTVTFQVTNRSSAVNNMAYRLYLSLDGQIDASDTIISSGNLSFPASSTADYSVLATVPPSVNPSFYFLIASVDPNNTLSEADETNNVALGVVSVGSDVQPVSIRAPATSGRGAHLDMTLDIANNGATFPDMPYEVYLSSDFNFDPAIDSLIASGTVTADRGVVTSVEVHAVVPTNITPGTYQIIVSVDRQNLVTEYDETNNNSVLASINLIGPDLSCESLSGDHLGFVGQPYHLTAVIANVGGEPITGFYTSFHLSANQLCTASDPVITEVGPIDLDEGDRTTLSPAPIIPTGTALGPYYLCCIVDSHSSVMDTRPQNNIRRAPDQITVRNIAPDFVITDLLIPTIAGAGETFALQRTLENQGNDLGTVPYSIFLVTQTGATVVALIGQGNLAMSVGQINNGVDNVTIPADVASGVYKIQYSLDPDTLVDEIFEDNNLTLSDETIQVENAQLLITTMTLPVATTGVDYQADLFAQGGAGPLTWSISAGSLPEGLTIDGPTGRISGVANTEGVSHFTAHVTDGANTHERMLQITVAAPTIDLRIVTRELPPVWVGQHYEYPLTSLGGVPPYSWTVRPALPAGLTLTSSGTLAGDTSTTAPSAVFTFRVEDAVHDTAEAPLTVRVLARDDALRFATLSLPDGVVGTDYSAMLDAENGVPEYVFSVADGELPPGLSIATTSNGSEVSGVPSEPGVFTFRLRVTDSRGDFDLNYFVVEIAASDEVNFVTKGLPPGKLNVAYKDRDDRPVTLKAIVLSGSGSIEYTVVQGKLPMGLELAIDGGISGTPTEKGVFPFTARAYDTMGKTEDLRAFGIVIEEDAMTMLPGTTDTGCGCNSTNSANGSLAAMLALGLAAWLGRKRRS